MSERGFAAGGRIIGPGEPCFVIAEAGVNHDGDVRKALALVDAAAVAGADAVKFQTFNADRLVTAAAPKAGYQRRATRADESQREMLRRLELGAAAHQQILARCREQNIMFLSTPFDEESADFLGRLGMPLFKVPSGEITNLPYLRHLAGKKRPLVLSTGMATLEEVLAAVSAVREVGAPDLAVLQCVSEYPAPAASANLLAMGTLQRACKTIVGYSDHTLGIEVALASVALGASILEKHFTLDRTAEGPDHAASLEPRDLELLVRGVRTVETSLGSGVKMPTAGEREVALVARKSLVAARPLTAGATLMRDDVAIRRPATGAPPAQLDNVIGRRLNIDLQAGDPIRIDMLQ